MDQKELNKLVIGMNLEYKNVIVDAELTRMIRFKNEQGWCDLVRRVHWVEDVEHTGASDIVTYTMMAWCGDSTYLGGFDLGKNYYNAKRKFLEMLAEDKLYIHHLKQKKDPTI